MASIDQAVDFARRWTAAEWEVIQALHRERDPAAFAARVAALAAGFLGEGMDPRMGRSEDEAFWSRAEEYLASRQRRPLFRVDRHAHPALGELFALHVGSTNAGSRAPFSRYFARDAGSGLRLVAQENVCPECDGAGAVAGAPCPECGGRGFLRRGGPALGDPGPVVETRELETPGSYPY